MHPTMPRRAAAAALLVAILVPRSGKAHSILMDSTPRAGGTVSPGTVAVRLRFNSRVDAARSGVSLHRADRSPQVLAIVSGGAGDVLTAAADVQPGAYTLQWQVFSVDGHIVRGEVPFTVSPA